MNEASQVLITRKVDVSCAHRYYLASESEAKNREIYGALASPVGLGHNLRVLATIKSAIDPASGLAWPGFDAALKEVTDELDHRSLHLDIPWFQSHVPTAENIAEYIYLNLQSKLPKNSAMARIRVHEGTDLYVDRTPTGTRLTQMVVIHALHRHHNPNLSMEENRKLYYKCAEVHGHEYRVFVTVEGPIDPRTGLVVSRSLLGETLKAHLLDPFDKNFLNDELGNTSGEIIVKAFYDRLKPYIPGMVNLGLRETRKNSFSVATERAAELL